MHRAGVAEHPIAHDLVSVETVPVNSQVPQVADPQVRAVKTDRMNPGEILGDVPRLDHRQVAGPDLGHFPAIQRLVVLAPFGTVQQACPQEAVVIVDRPEVIDPVDADGLLLDQLPVLVEAADGAGVGREVVSLPQGQSLGSSSPAQAPLLEQRGQGCFQTGLFQSRPKDRQQTGDTLLLGNLDHRPDPIDQGKFDSGRKQPSHFPGLVGTAVVDADLVLLQQPRVGRVNRCTAQQLDESRLGCDRLIDVPAGIGLPFHVADLDLRVSTTGRSRRTTATGQERLVLSPVGTILPATCPASFSDWPGVSFR